MIVLDAGGQYCHLIARRVRDLGVYTEVRPSETPAAELSGARGIIVSGGPASVYDTGSPRIDPAILDGRFPVLGICYGLQLITYLLGGDVRQGVKGEYGSATLELKNGSERSELLSGMAASLPVWMSHKDVVAGLPPGFALAGSTATCAAAVIEAPERSLYGVQFHPEVVHSAQGQVLLANFVFRICRCRKDWAPDHQVSEIEREIRETTGERNIFFFVSGGVDSTVAFTLCLRALGPNRVRGIYVDTGLMREGETEAVEQMFVRQGGEVSVERASNEFLGALAGARDPEEKRAVIGEAFVSVQERIIEKRHLLDGHWILGQGTIYPDTIESGGTLKAAVIKTHHNRVPGIQKLIESGRIIEPLQSFYKDEVRIIGTQLGIAPEYLERHPFPGPGLAIRCLCSETDAELVPGRDGVLIPVRTVGVQGDFRTYAPVLAIDQRPDPSGELQDRATDLVNSRPEINRVIALVASRAPLNALRVFRSSVTAERVATLRRADAIVRDLSRESGFDRQIWQFPVVLIPVGSEDAPDSVVLRPVDSVDGMTARSIAMGDGLLSSMTERLLTLNGIAAVFYDLTHKPPATIEWE